MSFKSFGAMSGYNRQAILLVLILLVASVLRLYHLGQSSLWYDEVVTMRLAWTESPRSLLRLLGQIDATRAPLHPLVLQGWVKLFGRSDYSGRAFSALCGIITVALVYWIGLQAANPWTGLAAAWLCAVSPLLVYYSREARMYMWLVLVTCCAWGLLFSLSRSPQPWKLALYGLSLIALVYSHPLGLLMVGALGLVTVVFRQMLQISWRRWLYIYLVVTLAVVPWVSQYVDHAPESTSGLLPLQYLLGMPIGFIGGNSQVLLVCMLLIVYGLCQVKRQPHGWIQIALKPEPLFISLLIWLVIPPLLLYAYSRALHPIFGPARYTLFVGPAYLLLVARGVSKLPWPLSIMAMIASTVLSGVMLLDDVYGSDRYADWRSATAYLDRREPEAAVAVITGGTFGNTELETARYYFGSDRVVVPWIDPAVELISRERSIWVSISLQDGQPIGKLPAVLDGQRLIREVVDFSRLRLMKVDFHHPSASGE